MNDNTYYTSFDDLYMQYHRIVFGVCLSILHNEEAAKDITQEVFIRLYQWRSRIKDENKIKGWLCVTARNMSLNSLRITARESALGEVCAVGTDPEEIYIVKEEQSEFFSAISALKDSYSEILSLRYGLDFSIREIAVVTGMPVASVYTRLHRAERALEKRLKEAEK